MSNLKKGGVSARTKFVVRTLDTQKSMSDLKTDDWWTEFGSYHDTYTIEIRPLTKCNYNCYYCTDNRINSNPIINLNVPNTFLFSLLSVICHRCFINI